MREANPRETRTAEALMRTELAQYEPLVYPDEAVTSEATDLTAFVMVEKVPAKLGLGAHA